MKKLIASLALLALAGSVILQEPAAESPLSKIDEFKTRYFRVIKKDHIFHEIDVGIPANETMHLGAFGDLNGDRM